MIIGLYTFIHVINRETLKVSQQPINYILNRGIDKFLVPSRLQRDKLGRLQYEDPVPLEIADLGVREVLELHFASSSTGTIKESEFYVNRILRPLQLGKGQELQGVELASLTPKTSIFFQTVHGDAKLVTVKGHSARSIVHARLLKVNVLHSINNVFIQGGS